MWKNLKSQKVGSKAKKQSRDESLKGSEQGSSEKNIESKISLMEKQLAKSRENTALLMKKLSEAEEVMERMEI